MQSAPISPQSSRLSCLFRTQRWRPLAALSFCLDGRSRIVPRPLHPCTGSSDNAFVQKIDALLFLVKRESSLDRGLSFLLSGCLAFIYSAWSNLLAAGE